MRTRLALLALAFAPTLALAQPGGGGPRGGGMGGGGMAMGGRMPSGSDLEKQSALRALLANKKKLSLADSQVSQIEALAEKTKAQDATLYQRVDSLRKHEPAAGDFATMSDDERQRMIAWRVASTDVMDAVRASQGRAAEQAMALLTGEQREKAREAIMQQREDQRRAQRKSDEAQDLGKGYGKTRRP